MRKIAKGIISIVLAIIMAISVIPTDIYAADEPSSTESQSIASGTCGDNLNWEITADYKLVISGSGDMYDYWNKNVDKELILAPWGEYASDIREIVIGDAVTKIGRYAFCNFTSLTEIIVPNNVTYIGQCAFSGATALVEMSLPFVGQGEGAKYNMTSLLGYIFSSSQYEGSVKCTQTSVDRNYSYTFYLPATLKKISVTGSTLFGGAFSGCVALEEVILNGDIQTIEARTFANCTNLKEITIPQSVTSVDIYAFSGCESMKSFTISSDFTCQSNSFDSDYIEEVYISCDVYDLYYDKTTNQWIKSDFKSWMSANTFVSCHKIHTEVSDNICVKCNADIKEEMEDQYQQLEDYYQAVTAEVGKNTLLPDKFAFKFTAEHEDLYTFSISDVSFITQLLLDGNKVTKQKCALPYSVRMKKGETILAIVEYYEGESLNLSIAAQLGSDYGDLIAFGKVNDKIKWILEESGTLILEGTGAVPDYDAYQNYPISNSEIFYEAAPPWIRYAKYIKKLKVKEGITKLGKDNFCDGHYSMYYADEGAGGEWNGPADAYIHNIDMALEFVELASSVVEIGDEAFRSALSKGAKEFKIPGTVKKIGTLSFMNNTPLITIQEGVETIGERAFENAYINQSKLPDSIIYIGNSAFNNCKFSQDLLILPNSLETIGDGAFTRCESLKKVVLPEGLKIIGDGAFQGCANLEEVNMPESLEEIGSHSFTSTSLKALRFGNNVKKIGSYAFFHGRYSYVKVPGVENLEEYVFIDRDSLYDDYDAEKDAKGLQTIVVSEGVKTMGPIGGYKWGRLVLPKSLLDLDYSYDGTTNSPGLAIHNNQLTDYFIPTIYIYRNTYVDELFHNPTFSGHGLGPFGHIEYIVAAGDCGYNTYFVLTENNELVLLGEGDMYDYESVEDVPWYPYADKIENIEISRDITSVGNNAFANCKNLKSIYYPMMKDDWDTKEYMCVDNLNKIGKDAFKGCENFVLQCHVDSTTNKYIYSKKIDVTVDTVENKCGEECYWNIDSNGTLTISGTGNIEDYSAKKAPWYTYRTSIKKVVLGEDIQGIGEYAFYGCYNLLSVEGMESIQSVGSHAFDGCTKLENLELGENCEIFSITSILNCKKIKTFYLPINILDITDLEEYSDKVPFLVIEDGFELEELLDEYEVRYRRVNDILVEDIVIHSEKETFNIRRNASTNMLAEIYPEDATNSNIEWKSSNQAIAEVNEEGEVTFVGEGSVYISAFSKDGTEVYAEKRIEIVDEELIENIVLSQSEVILNKNTNQYIALTASCAEQEIDSDRILWSSSEQSVADVQNGYVFAVGEGVAEIKCISKEDDTVYATCKVEVHLVEKVEIEPTCEVKGYTRHQCTECSKVVSIENEVEATGHHMVEMVSEEFLISAATCTQKAKYAKLCSNCSVVKDTELFEYGEYLPHVDTDYSTQCDQCEMQIVETKDNYLPWLRNLLVETDCEDSIAVDFNGDLEINIKDLVRLKKQLSSSMVCNEILEFRGSQNYAMIVLEQACNEKKRYFFNA